MVVKADIVIGRVWESPDARAQVGLVSAPLEAWEQSAELKWEDSVAWALPAPGLCRVAQVSAASGLSAVLFRRLVQFPAAWALRASSGWLAEWVRSAAWVPQAASAPREAKDSLGAD